VCRYALGPTKKLRKIGVFILEKIMKLTTKKAKLHKKMRVKDQTPGSLIKKANSLPKANTRLGVAIRGLI
jgi:hypothetical protein